VDNHLGTSHWPRGRARHGGVDEIPLPEGPGRLWLSGKRFVAPDPEAARAEVDASRVVCLCEREELEDRYPAYVDWLESHRGAAAIWFPVPDLHAPPFGATILFIGRLRALITSGDTVLMHCGAGIGRAGTLAAALLVRMGTPLPEALTTIAESRPMAGPEAGAQVDLLVALATWLDSGSAPVIPGP
jgi:ADP-ribosyl-[dinitrogen reductase] hydrolase